MLRKDATGAAYVPPGWWPGPRPDADASGKQAEKRDTSDLFRRTGEKS